MPKKVAPLKVAHPEHSVAQRQAFAPRQGGEAEDQRAEDQRAEDQRAGAQQRVARSLAADQQPQPPAAARGHRVAPARTRVPPSAANLVAWPGTRLAVRLGVPLGVPLGARSAARLETRFEERSAPAERQNRLQLRRSAASRQPAGGLPHQGQKPAQHLDLDQAQDRDQDRDQDQDLKRMQGLDQALQRPLAEAPPYRTPAMAPPLTRAARSHRVASSCPVPRRFRPRPEQSPAPGGVPMAQHRAQPHSAAPSADAQAALPPLETPAPTAPDAPPAKTATSPNPAPPSPRGCSRNAGW